MDTQQKIRSFQRRSSLIKERPLRKLVPKEDFTSSPRSRVGPVTCQCWRCEVVLKFRNERFQNNLEFMINQREFFSNICFYVFLCEMKHILAPLSGWQSKWRSSMASLGCSKSMWWVFKSPWILESPKQLHHFEGWLALGPSKKDLPFLLGLLLWGVSTYSAVSQVICDWTRFNAFCSRLKTYIGCVLVCESVYITQSKTHSTTWTCRSPTWKMYEI